MASPLRSTLRRPFLLLLWCAVVFGAEAVENAMRLARAATGRPNMIVFQGGYHGRSIGTLSLTRSKTGYGVANHPQMSGVFVAPFPYPQAG